MMSLKQENNIPSLTLQYNNKKLEMLKKQNYLEWTFKSFDGDNTFIITMEDYDIYEIFLTKKILILFLIVHTIVIY